MTDGKAGSQFGNSPRRQYITSNPPKKFLWTTTLKIYNRSLNDVRVAFEAMLQVLKAVVEERQDLNDVIEADEEVISPLQAP